MTPLLGFFVGVWRSRRIALQFAWREIQGRYRGSYLGLLWAVVVPVATVAIFSFVFGGIFNARWTTRGVAANHASFAVPMFAGLLVHLFVAECATRAPGLILGNVSFVKRVVFPLESLCSASVLAALFHVGVGFLVLLAWALAIGVAPTLQVLWMPLVWLPLVAFALGVSLLLSALGVFLRDISQVVGLVMTGLLFLAPIMYPIEAVPDGYRWLVYVNPLTPFVEMTRAVAVLGAPPKLYDYLLGMAFGVPTLIAGAWFFARARGGFADVI
ncbi:MAG: ABC transporter permease [Betaproteobacteria bacterium]